MNVSLNYYYEKYILNIIMKNIMKQIFEKIKYFDLLNTYLPFLAAAISFNVNRFRNAPFAILIKESNFKSKFNFC